MKIHKELVHYCQGAMTAIVLVTLCTSCNIFPRPTGTHTEAIAARALITEGRTFVATVQHEIEVLLQRFAVLPITQALLQQTAQGGQSIVSQSEVVNAYGIYTEDASAPGGFVFTPLPASNQIHLEYDNGTDATLLSFSFAPDLSNVSRFQLKVDANNRNIDTPFEDELRLLLTVDRPDMSMLTNLFDALNPSIVVVSGDVSYMRNGVMTKFRVTSSGTELSLTETTIRRVRDVMIEDVTLNLANPPFWKDTETANYTEIANQPGTFAAQTMDFSYQDWKGAGGAIGITAEPLLSAFPGIVGYNGTGFATYEGREVASASGGSYECDLTDPSAIGAGVPVILKWRDGRDQTLMPDPFLFACSNAIVVESVPAP